MPELPEVETTRRALEPHLVGRRIVRVQHDDPRLYQGTPLLEGQTVRAVDRRGKYLIIRAGEHLDAVVHLKMTGGFRLPPEGDVFAEAPRFERLRVVTDGGELSFTDMRRFGVWLVRQRGDYRGIDTLERMGPEPLSDDFDPGAFALAMARVPKVKPALLSQHHVAGLGNIYVDEALWLAGIHPEAGRLTREQSLRLHTAIRDVLGRAVEAGGSTLSDATYRRPDGEPGGFKLHHRVYDREGEPCERCASPVEKVRLAGRGTHFCPSCQPRG
ncbi:MAG TPA: bifunctional DNA-formamidopyrimidine glycosylase/DNA-(apurinic or apyrimidinic site) lyase [Deinococcales bacterium]|nr:bifunctional DNA-formamidopyrimidine glycosylase/DNA-(apurinic or apyrimidinic site) lyase [Deinococcales bacterium]